MSPEEREALARILNEEFARGWRVRGTDPRSPIPSGNDLHDGEAWGIGTTVEHIVGRLKTDLGVVVELNPGSAPGSK